MSFFNGSGLPRLRRGVLGNVYPILALLVAILLRLIPAVVAWPYAVGFDTTALYIPAMLNGPPSLSLIFTYPGLHFLLLWLAYRLIQQPFVVLSTGAVLLQGILALSSYFYSRSVISLKKLPSFLTSLVFTLSPITLRLTWDQYRMSLSLAAIMIAFIALSTTSSRKRALAIPLTILVILTNPLPSVFLLLSLGVQAPINYFRSRPYFIEASSFIIGGVIFGLQQVSFSSGVVGTTIPLGITGLSAGTSEALYGLGFLVFTSWPLLIFLPLTLKTRSFSPHVSWLLILAVFAIILVSMGVYTIPTPFIYLMSSFPLAMSVGTAMKRFGPNRLFRVTFAIVLIFLSANALSYVSSSPLTPNPYVGMGQSFAYYFPMGYLQSTVPLSYQTNLTHMLATATESLPANSVLYLARQFYGLALLSPNSHSISIVDIGEVNPWLPSPFSSIHGNNQSFTVWFINGEGWYGISSLPSNFKPVEIEGHFGLYQIDS